MERQFDIIVYTCGKCMTCKNVISAIRDSHYKKVCNLSIRYWNSKTFCLFSLQSLVISFLKHTSCLATVLFIINQHDLCITTGHIFNTQFVKTVFLSHGWTSWRNTIISILSYKCIFCYFKHKIYLLFSEAKWQMILFQRVYWNLSFSFFP